MLRKENKSVYYSPKNNLAKGPEEDLLRVVLKEKSHLEFCFVKGLFEFG